MEQVSTRSTFDEEPRSPFLSESEIDEASAPPFGLPTETASPPHEWQFDRPDGLLRAHVVSVSVPREQRTKPPSAAPVQRTKPASARPARGIVALDWPIWLVGGCAILIIGLSAAVIFFGRSTPASTTSATLTVESSPPGATVRVDDESRGTTPIQVPVTAGSRQLEVEYGGVTYEMAVELQPGETVTRQLDFITTREPGAPAAAAEATSPPGTDLPQAALSSVGWIRVGAPEPLQIIHNGKWIGRSGPDRITLPAGAYALVVVSDELGFSARRNVKVPAGATESVWIDLPRVPLAINAEPSADVWLDGESLGTTPLAAVDTPIGRHELFFRHPELGEQHRSVTVTLRTPARIDVDLAGRD